MTQPVIIGRATLYNADALDVASVAETDCLVCDPPPLNRDNMEFEARVTCYQRDALNRVIAAIQEQGE